MTSRDHQSTHYQFSPYMVPLDPPLVPIGALTVNEDYVGTVGEF